MCYIYLLHFSEKISPKHTCQHYIGSTDDLAERLERHRSGNGARLVEVATARGISFSVVRVWQGERGDEKRLKAWAKGPKLCPICSENPLNPRFIEEIPLEEIL